MKEIRKAKIVYNEEKDSFEIHINTGDGWGFSVGYPCVARENCTEKNFIHWGILRKLDELVEFGYSIDFGGA